MSKVIITPLYDSEVFRTAGRINFVGPQPDVPASVPSPMTRSLGWMMDSYSTHGGHIAPAVVTGKPLSFGGPHGRREAAGAGFAYLVKAYFPDPGIPFTRPPSPSMAPSAAKPRPPSPRSQGHRHLRLQRRHRKHL